MKNHIERFDQDIDRKLFQEIKPHIIDQAITIQQIPAPTFQELQRAEYVKSRFEALGLEETSIDEMYNVFGVMRGKNSSLRAIMVAAHTDTVFHHDEDLTIRREGDLIYGPGLGDNSMGVAGLLGTIELIQSTGISPVSDIWFVATSREEGLGDLGGMRAAFQRLESQIRAVINIEGLAFGYIYHAGIAVRRLCITATTEGGHSWLHFGRPSAINGIIDLGARIAKITPPTSPRTTYNIGLIEGGLSINTIAPSAKLWLDMRSEELNALNALDADIRKQINILSSNELKLTVEVVGDRPSGKISIHHPLIKGAITSLENVGMRPVLETGSTDGNIPLAAGCPTVTIGVTRGGNAHRTDEFIETAPIEHGMRQLVVLTLATSAETGIKF